MDFFKNLTKKVTQTATETVSDSVKTEVKTATVNAIPALIGIGTVIFGILVFKSAPKTSHFPLVPKVSTMKVVTNNYFFVDDKVKTEVINKITRIK